jgi:hypothetical protein
VSYWKYQNLFIFSAELFDAASGYVYVSDNAVANGDLVRGLAGARSQLVCGFSLNGCWV